MSTPFFMLVKKILYHEKNKNIFFYILFERRDKVNALHLFFGLI